MKAVVAERGQVTIPKALRLKLGIKPGTVLDFYIKETVLVVVKHNNLDPVEKVYGCLKQHKSTDKIIDELRGNK